MTNRYFTIINLLLITAGIYLAVSGFYRLVGVRLDSTASAPPVFRPAEPSTRRSSVPPFGAYKAIVVRNIFNASSRTPVPPAIDLEKLKQTKLKLKLWGTVTSPSRDAYAVIEDIQSRRQDLYRAGDTVQDAVVKLVLRGRVVLNVNGHDEILNMEEVSSQAGRQPVRRVGAAAGRKLPVSRYTRKIRLRSEQIQKAMANLGEFMQQATLRPHMEGGRPSGISITAIQPHSLFRKMRLRNGDIITGVNGEPIQSVEDALRVFDQLSPGFNIQLQIKRRGREQTIEYSIE